MNYYYSTGITSYTHVPGAITSTILELPTVTDTTGISNLPLYDEPVQVLPRKSEANKPWYGQFDKKRFK